MVGDYGVQLADALFSPGIPGIPTTPRPVFDADDSIWVRVGKSTDRTDVFSDHAK